MSAETTKQELDRSEWEIPLFYPYSEVSNPNPRNEREWVRELSEQVEFLTTALASANARIDELELKTKRPPPKTTTQPKAKSGGG